MSAGALSAAHGRDAGDQKPEVIPVTEASAK